MFKLSVSESCDDSFYENQTRMAFVLYCFYLVSFFVRLPARISFLALIRFDFLLVLLIGLIITSKVPSTSFKFDSASRYIFYIFMFSVVSLPLVEWPGTVISLGIIEFVKGVIFYFFTVLLVCNIDRLKFVFVIFISCNLFRILEPLYLNLTSGYLGSETHLGYGDFAGRLAGSPSDTINPNGLAFVIVTIFPFLHYIFAPISRKTFFLYLLLIPILLYTMGLTLSRSGLIALAIIGVGIWWNSAHKFSLAFLGLLIVGAIFLSLNDVQRDRYLSIVSDDARQSSSAKGRIEGWGDDLKVALNRPLIGHGLGTSREANWNISGRDIISHNLWIEIWQEIGLIGLALFIMYLSAIINNFRDASRLIKEKLSCNDFLYRSCQAMKVWLLMNLFFSLASYGLKSYEWYFFGGLSVVLIKLVRFRIAKSDRNEHGSNAFADSSWRFGLARRINRF